MNFKTQQQVKVWTQLVGFSRTSGISMNIKDYDNECHPLVGATSVFHHVEQHQ